MRKILVLSVLLFVMVFLVGAGNPAGQAVQRPIEEFVNAQGTYCIDDGQGGCEVFVPPIENFVFFTDPMRGSAAVIDYAGLANDWILEESGGEVSLGTETAGTVIEQPLADGRAEVHVVLRTKNALTWVVEDPEFEPTGPLVFGHRAPEVLNEGKEPGLCNSVFEVKFIHTNPGGDLPDMIQILFFPEEGQEVLYIAERCNAAGPLREGFDDVPDGTPGRASVVETGLLMTPFRGAVGDGFPVERIELHVVGK